MNNKINVETSTMTLMDKLTFWLLNNRLKEEINFSKEHC